MKRRIMRIIVIGSGAREHAIVWKLNQSKLTEKVFLLPGNGGTENNINIKISDFEGIKKFCKLEKINLIIVGPEVPLVNGIVDYFEDSKIKVFGPDKTASKLEGSKIFAKKFMKKYGVATGNFREFKNKDSAEKFIKNKKGNCVVKYDGLAAGKGVYVCSEIEEAEKAIEDIDSKYGKKASFLIEEKLIGSELSIIAFTDGENYQLLLPSQDHKQLLDGNKGPNTGGMGAFCPVPFYNDELHKKIIKEIIDPTIKGIKEENFNYKGVIYFGLMVTENGPKVLEYNVRLGDPETEVILPALRSDLLELIFSCFNGSLKNFKIEFNDGYFVDVVLASGGYPKFYRKGYEITGFEKLNKDTIIFHAGTKKEDNKILTNGGRVLNVVSKGISLGNAIDNVYKECKKVRFKDVYFRNDIGKRSFNLEKCIGETSNETDRICKVVE